MQLKQKKLTPFQEAKRRALGGRPTLVTDSVVVKLEQAFALDCTVTEACSFADISRSVFYDWINKHPEFNDRIEQLRQKPVLKARTSVVNGLDDHEFALKYLERKMKKEFSLRQELTGADGKDIQPVLVEFINGKQKNNTNS